MKTIAETLGVARSNLYDRLEGTTHSRGRYHRRGDAELLARITRLVTARPTYGYRRITAVLNRELKAEALPPANHKRVYRLMQMHRMLLARRYTERPDHIHDGKVVVMRSCDGVRTASSSPAGMVPSSAASSSSMRTTAKSSPGGRWSTPASAAPTSVT